jgi:hypothetical protein
LTVDHVADLKRVREGLVRQRRAMAAELAQAPSGGAPGRVDDLVKSQQAIEALDRAIREEERAADLAAAANRRAAFMRHEDDPYDDIDSLGG